MTISVVIPSFNQAEYLRECIESVYNQTFPAHEILVIDDGSTDGSLQLAREYEFNKYPLIESPVRVISQTNKGLPSARNTGVMNATGDYIFFLDADDKIFEHTLERVHQEILATNADVIAPSFRMFGKHNQDVILQGFSLDDMKQANRLGYFCAIKRSVLQEVGGYNPKMKYGYEDYDLWFDLIKKNKTFVILQEILVMYRTKEHSMLTTANQHADELLAQIRKNHPELWT